LPESLIESELFGYEKGAFTGADTARAGLIESAQNGTLFLDEITTLNPGLQSKLLRVLQERTVQRVGGRSSKRIDFRLICATNDDLEDLVRKGQFREDLYYRINVVPILVPPLRDRDGDVALLADYFLRNYCAAAKKPLKTVQPEVLEILEEYPWPGNVRELENLVERLAIFCSSGEIGVADVERERQMVRTNGLPDKTPPSSLEDMERQHILRVLQEHAGNKSKAARALGIERKTLYQKARRLGIDLMVG
jgi:transcriptional regulator with PAS, ATPase and Fis domain